MQHKKHNTQILSKVQSDSTVYVKTSTPYISAVKRIDKMLEKFSASPLGNKKYQHGEYKKVKCITIRSMGSAMQKAVSVGLHYQVNCGYDIDIYTDSVRVIDQVKAEQQHVARDDSDDETELRERIVSSIEVKIWLKDKQ